jgi:hypothetical protein
MFFLKDEVDSNRYLAVVYRADIDGFQRAPAKETQGCANANCECCRRQ